MLIFDAKQEVAVTLNREAIDAAPPYDPGRITSRDYQVALKEYYGFKFEEEGGV